MPDENSNHANPAVIPVYNKGDTVTRTTIARRTRSIEQFDDEDEGEERITIEELNEEVRITTEDPSKSDNSYAAKKTVAQGMMDIALITANANQLRFLVEFTSNAGISFYVNVILIVLSLLLQVGIGVLLVFKGRLDLKGYSKRQVAKIINNYIVLGVFLVTIINVFIASFTVADGKRV